MQFGIDEAQERFEELLARAASGEEILIGEGERTVSWFRCTANVFVVKRCPMRPSQGIAE